MKALLSQIKPPKLELGDTIGLVSPSWCGAALAPYRLKQGVAELEKLGFRVKLSKNALIETNYTAGNALTRASDINDMFADQEVKAIMTMIGGNHSNQILSHLDYNLIQNNPKIFIGYSDITVLDLAIFVKTGLVTFHGPNLLSQFGEYPHCLDYTKEYFLRATTKTEPIGKIQPSNFWTEEYLDWIEKQNIDKIRKLLPNQKWHWLRSGSAKGILIGGCINSLVHLRGTEYWPNFDGALFFWEIPMSFDGNHGESVANIDTLLTDLELSGVFNLINGMIIGRPYHYSDKDLQQLFKILLERTSFYNFPILFNVDFGHTDPMITIPIGVNGILDSARNKFAIKETAVS